MSIPAYVVKISEIVCGIVPSPICLSFAQGVTLPLEPGFGSSISNSIFTVTSPVGIGSVEVCL
jgi:hypothetical protein